jgi:hypothetical protein
VRRGIRWTASSGHPKCRESATYVRDPGHCEPPAGRRRNRSVPGCGARSPAIRSSLADRIKGEKKIFCCVTMRGRDFGAFNDLDRSFGLLSALFLGLGMLGPDAIVPATLSLAASCLPAVDLSQALRVLTVALVPASWLVLASTSFAQADPLAWSAPSGQTAVLCFNVGGAHGSCNSQGKSSGRMCNHPPRALSKREQDPFSPVYRLLANKTENQTLPSIAPGTRRALSAAARTIVFPRTRQRNKWSHRRAANKNPARCPSNDHRRCRIRDRSHGEPAFH